MPFGTEMYIFPSLVPTGRGRGLWERVRAVCTLLQSLSGTQFLTAGQQQTHTCQSVRQQQPHSRPLQPRSLGPPAAHVTGKPENMLPQCGNKCHIMNRLLYTFFTTAAWKSLSAVNSLPINWPVTWTCGFVFCFFCCVHACRTVQCVILIVDIFSLLNDGS